MRPIPNSTIRAIGEAMIELAPLPGGSYQRGFAGDTFNTAWHMAQVLGAQAQVGMVTQVGRDAISAAFMAEMQADGMALSGVSQDAKRTMGLYMIELTGVERSFHYWRSASAARHLADDPARLAAALQGVGLIHLSGITLAILSPKARRTLFAALADARAQGTVVSFDPNIRPRLWSSPRTLRETITQMLGHTDIALPSIDDEAAHFGDATAQHTLHRMAHAGVPCIIVKNGAGPVATLTGGIEASFPTPPAGSIRDTTGAGDAFNAGFLAACVHGLPVEQAVNSGQTLAACVLDHFGARATKQSLSELRLFPTA
jgi:2-dehydro-3-deoxygluconokinase